MRVKPEIINLCLEHGNMDKLGNGQSIQLTKEQLHNAIINKPNCELHLLKKHVTKIINAHKTGAGIRITQDKIVGGSFNFEN